MRLATCFLIVVVALAACWLAAVRIRFSAERVVLDKLEQIQPGMTIEEVNEVMAGFRCNAIEHLMGHYRFRTETWRIGEMHGIHVYYVPDAQDSYRVAEALRCRPRSFPVFEVGQSEP